MLSNAVSEERKVHSQFQIRIRNVSQSRCSWYASFFAGKIMFKSKINVHQA